MLSSLSSATCEIQLIDPLQNAALCGAPPGSGRLTGRVFTHCLSSLIPFDHRRRPACSWDHTAMGFRDTYWTLSLAAPGIGFNDQSSVLRCILRSPCRFSSIRIMPKPDFDPELKNSANTKSPRYHLTGGFRRRNMILNQRFRSIPVQAGASGYTVRQSQYDGGFKSNHEPFWICKDSAVDNCNVGSAIQRLQCRFCKQNLHCSLWELKLNHVSYPTEESTREIPLSL